MKTWLTEYYASNEVGRVCKMGGDVKAETEEEAKAKAKALGHTFLGELVGEEEVSPEMNDYIERVQKERDDAWLKSEGAGDGKKT